MEIIIDERLCYLMRLMIILLDDIRIVLSECNRKVFNLMIEIQIDSRLIKM